jgi:TRAP transporter TAXI family solute receptor
MKDRRVDLMISGSYAPDGRIVELNASTPVRFVHFTEEESKRIADRLSLESAVIPSGTYDFQPDDAHVPVSSHMIIAGPAATFEESYKIARALVENLDVYRATHPALRSMTKESVVPKGPGIVIHPGAAAYYKEVGLLKDQ